MAIALALVLGSGLAHAVWNLFTKASRNKDVFLWLITFGGTVVFLPFLIHDMKQGVPADLYWLIGLTFLFQMSYGFLLPKAYQRADLSQIYPIMRGIGALLVPIIGVAIYHEYVSVLGWIGIAIIVIGLFAINGKGLFGSRRGALLLKIWPALLVGLCITGYTLTDKSLVQHLSPFALIEVGNLALMVVLTPKVLSSGKIKEELKLNWKRILLGTILSPGSYLLFLFAMKIGPVSHLAPIREMSTVFGTILAVWLLKEADGVRRMLYASVIVIGVIIVGMWGGEI